MRDRFRKAAGIGLCFYRTGSDGDPYAAGTAAYSVYGKDLEIAFRNLTNTDGIDRRNL